jgi:hypothetical protein
MSYFKKPPPAGPSIETCKWIVAHFPGKEARDQFLAAVGSDATKRWEAEPVGEDGGRARVRWRQGHFLSLNDLAVKYHGRIAIAAAPRSG